MNRLTKELARMMRPEAALIVYGSADDYGRKDYFLESRSIGKDGLPGAGKPVSLRFVRSLADSFTSGRSSVPHGEIPKSLLYADTAVCSAFFSTSGPITAMCVWAMLP